jgi:putative transposase
MLDKTAQELPLKTQASILGLNRTGIYYEPVPPSERELYIKSRIDHMYTDHPEFGYRRMTANLNTYEHVGVNHKAVRKYMRDMGIEAIYPRQNTSKAEPGNIIYPYLLKGLDITRPNHVWSIDITYIPIKKSWLYLVAIIDWYSRYVVSWALDDTMEIDFVLDTCNRALASAKPEIMNSDQGSHFTSPKYTAPFLAQQVRISMDHRGRAYDNIFIERLWRSLKYENVYIMDYETPRGARQGITKYLEYYNNKRLHQSLGYETPADVYFGRSGIPTFE